MKKTVIDISEMSDSKEMYGQRPNPFVAIFIYSLVALLILGIVFSCFMKIDIVSTASGIIRPNEKVSTVTTSIGGKIKQINYFDGKHVEKGDTICVIDVSDKQITLDALNEKKDKANNQIATLDKYILGIENGNNPFSNDPRDNEYQYYIDYKNYDLTLKNTANNEKFDYEKANSNITSLNEQIQTLEYRKNGLNAYKNSVEQNTNLAQNYPEYENMYLAYEQTLAILKNEYDTECQKIVSTQDNDSFNYYLNYYNNLISEYTYLINSIEAEQSVFPVNDSSHCKLLFDEYMLMYNEYLNANATSTSAEAYRVQKLAEYKSILGEYQNKLAELKTSAQTEESKELQLSNLKTSYQASIEQQKTKALSEINALMLSAKSDLESVSANYKIYTLTIDYYKKNKDENGTSIQLSLGSVQKINELLLKKDELQSTLDEMNTEIRQLSEQISQGNVIAECSGIVSANNVMATGDLVSAGTNIATIIPDNENRCVVYMYLKNSDIAHINLGDSVKINVLALPSSQYGFAKGSITKIYADTIVQDGEYSGYFLVESSIENQTLTNNQGENGELSIGMQVEAKIVTERKSIMSFLLEKINIFS